MRRRSEATFQEHVIAQATAHGYAAYSVRNSKAGIVTLRGYPDLHLFRDDPPDSFWLELKTITGEVGKDQKHCIAFMRRAGLEVHIVRPKDLPWIIRRLKPDGQHAAG